MVGRNSLKMMLYPLVNERISVRGRMDKAYYNKEVVEWIEARHWDFSASVTKDNYFRPVLDGIEGLRDSG